MKLRIFTEPQLGATYEQQLRVAQATEELGFDAFFRSDHYLAMGREGWPGPTDSWITLGALARETSTVRLGTLVTPVTFRWPGVLAISVAQVDVMSGGRVELGLGSGWFAEEHYAYAIPFPPTPERFDMLEEQLAIVTGLWETPLGERFNHTGEHFSIVDSPGLPKPVQHPRPPVIMGGSGRTRSASLAARYAAEYNVAFAPEGKISAAFDGVRAACAGAGRARESMRYSVAQTVCCGRDDAEVSQRAEAIDRDPAELRATGLGGTPAELVDRIGQFASLGASTVYLQVLDLDDLDHLELIAENVLPQVA
ncbi:MAG TPA: TIGR03560 family F420-dependent LLM class oxidoreductase [Jiangellaceae bacterium]|jgi:F420-dependent oxidoreductase-like protein|nr:TIGR03560 family F420-dependent LLM class oxidoreductase [Jiangellaceae bacterium]